MNTQKEHNQTATIGLDKPISAQQSLREAWQRAAAKHGAQYANDIFPGGQSTAAHSQNVRDNVRLAKEIYGEGSPEHKAMLQAAADAPEAPHTCEGNHQGCYCRYEKDISKRCT